MRRILFLGLIYLLLPFQVFAQTPPVTITPIPTPTIVSYELPYPGLLPGTPLYPLKTFRDKVVSFFITDPVKQAQFDLLQSDKRVNAALFLTQEKYPNEQLVITTLSKAENYFEEGLGNLRIAKKQGKSVLDIADTFVTASGKYQQIVTGLETRGTKNFQKEMAQNSKRLSLLQKSATKLSK